MNGRISREYIICKFANYQKRRTSMVEVRHFWVISPVGGIRSYSSGSMSYTSPVTTAFRMPFRPRSTVLRPLFLWLFLYP
ncbi:hypothetical protein C8P63_103164 [Melghirimyces profundicolus]|uniref:Uncharacterized protein n=1 Tax=Melghirimyces profundicolus TaxID=1242148 RepID=A0A2T6C7S9_9BACL|nr:hypothetical protein C8P63_103164 [Melghirimyces profundicolus]